MRRLARKIGFRVPRLGYQWDLSIGEERGIVKNGRYTCWEVIGPARDLWDQLGPELMDYVGTSCKTGTGSGLSLQIYMIGRTEQTATPKVLICSKDIPSRKEVRKAIMGSGILDNYPGIGLGDTSQLPDLLAKEDVNKYFPADSQLSGGVEVLSHPSDSPFGRRLFIRKGDGRLGCATAGPILHILDKSYQLTVGHVFSEVNNHALFTVSVSDLDDCNFDGQSDSEEDDSALPPDVKRDDIVENDKASLPSISCVTETASSSTCAIFEHLESSSSPAEKGQVSLPHPIFVSSRSVDPQNKKREMNKRPNSRRLNRLGMLVIVSETGPHPSLDYGLVELEGQHRHGINDIAFGNGSQTWLRVIKPAKIGKSSISVVTVTLSSKFLVGHLSATASYVRFPNSSMFQKLYPVFLNGTLEDGDCGSGIVDQAGNFYGHIVAGNTGTGLAYIVQSVDVFADLSERMGGDVLLAPPIAHIRKDRTRVDALHVIEIGSKRHLSQLPLQTKSKGAERPNGTATSNPAISDLPDLQHGHTLCGRQLDGISNGCIDIVQPSTGQGSLRGPSISGHISILRSMISIFQPGSIKDAGKWKGKEKHRDEVDPQNTSFRQAQNPRAVPILTIGPDFEQLFFSLPRELQEQIIACLSVPDILSLRTVSTQWFNLIMINEASIAKSFLEYNPIPRFATALYPRPIFSELNLNYICGLWHRLQVSSRLSALMANWTTEEHFQPQSEVDRLKFSQLASRMRRRLIPILFTTFHFFESYRHLHLQSLVGQHRDSHPNAYDVHDLETEIMDLYNNETLLQVHQTFSYLVSYLRRTLRPPSFYGPVERSLHGYRADPPSDTVHAAILFIGGLAQILRFSEISQYEVRRAVVDEWYQSISSKISKQELLNHRGRDWWARRRTSTYDSISSTNSTNSSPGTIFSTAVSRSSSNNQHRLSGGSNSVVIDSRSVILQPMGPLSIEHTQLLLHMLPSLQKLPLDTGAERLLLQRGAVGRRQDIKKNAQLMMELIREDITDADEMIFGHDVYTIPEHDSGAWGGLLDGRE